jgi:2-oxoglutarate dehydrogenase E1 component
MAKGIEAPIFHVNGDDPEAVFHIAKLAIEFRQQFQCDVIIDMWCYRRLGHNEADEPSYTQPLMYRRIKEIKTTRQLYAQRLIETGSISAQQHEEMKAEAVKRLTEAREKSKEIRVRDKVPKYSGVWPTSRASITGPATPAWIMPCSNRSSARMSACRRRSRRTRSS